jgi:hypothetical protein
MAAMFDAAAARDPMDADVHQVLGVLYNLSREYHKAVRGKEGSGQHSGNIQGIFRHAMRVDLIVFVAL